MVEKVKMFLKGTFILAAILSIMNVTSFFNNFQTQILINAGVDLFIMSICAFALLGLRAQEINHN
jgi:hypothetical protein